MQPVIDRRITETYSPRIGVINAIGIDNSKQIPEISALLDSASLLAQDVFRRLETPSEHPLIGTWRKTYKQFGADPQKYRSSIESLVRRVLKGAAIPRINTLVDLYNYVSLKYLIPIGGEDIDSIIGSLHLTLALGNEEFIRLNGSGNEPPLPDEVVYKDDAGVVCRRWNWREADRTKLTEKTAHAIIVIDAIPPTDRLTVKKAVDELADLITLHCGGHSTKAILDK